MTATVLILVQDGQRTVVKTTASVTGKDAIIQTLAEVARALGEITATKTRKSLSQPTEPTNPSA